MKRIIVFAVSLMFTATSFAQLTAKMIFSDFSVEVNSKKVEFQKVMTEDLSINVSKSIVLYEANGNQFVTKWWYKRSSNRLKIYRRNYIVKNGEVIKKGRLYKDVQFLKVGVPGEFKGRSAETILINKKALESMFVGYNFVMEYLPK
ncbi:MAG: hypothetical protein KKA07_06465 [Bacteroidetes bacterium]|nr:hypothetical protein [Bacteroidota bacterium]